MSIEILDCLKRKRDIFAKAVITSQNTAFMWTPALTLQWKSVLPDAKMSFRFPVVESSLRFSDVKIIAVPATNFVDDFG